MSETEFETERGPFRQRGFIASAAVLTVLLVLGVVVTLLTVFNDDPDTPGTAAPSSASEPSENSTDPATSRCGLPGLEESGTLSEPPEGVTWDLVGTIALPATEKAGPGLKDSGLRYCYAHTPEGALLMAANIFAWGEAKPEVVAANSIASGPGRDVVLAAIENGSIGGTDDGQEQLFQFRGFRLLAYTRDTAMVDLAIQGSSTGRYASMPIELAWEGGDWKVRLTPDGSPFNATPLPDLTGYIPWAGA